MSRHCRGHIITRAAAPGALTPIALLGGILAGPASAQSDTESLEPITVQSLRTTQGRALSAIPGSVTVIDEQQIAEQLRTTRDLGEILSNLVPGLGQSSQSMTNFGQRLRGRDFLVLIDGVPQNAVLRQAFKHLRSIAPEAIERVEVIRGAVATYGIGSTGGIINFITKSGQGIEGTEAQTTVGISGQTANSDSFGGRAYQGFRGTRGAFDYSVNLSRTQTGAFFDGSGDRIPPDGFKSQGGGLSEAIENNLQAKLGYQIGADQRLRFSFNYYDQEQDAEHTADATTGDPARDTPTRAVDREPRGIDPGTENLNLSLDYTLKDLADGTLSAQVYLQDYETQFGFFEFFETGPGQTFLETQHTGARLAHERGFFDIAHAVYGFDLGSEQTSQSFTDGRTNIGELEQLNYAPFLQVEGRVLPSLRLRGGVRHERVNVDVPTFQDESVSSPGTVEGGELDYSETVFNAGAVYDIADAHQAFFGFSQGFSVADVGRALREQSGQGNDVEAGAFEPDAKVVNNFELGWRGRGRGLQASTALFLSTSEEGTTFGGPPNFRLQQREERVVGLEASVDWQATDALAVGGTGSWQEGRVDTDGDGDVDTDLDGTRIAPPELTAYAEYARGERWSTRLQLKRVFGRDEFGDSAAFGQGEVEPFTLVDVSAEVQLGPGRLSGGIDNLFNEQYITPLGQAFNLTGFEVAGRGRSFTVAYSVTY